VNDRTDLFAAPRPVTTVADLLANVWQFGYVTNDLDRAMDFMADRFGLTHCLPLPSDTATFLVGDTPAAWEVKVAMGSRGGTIIELIEPVAGEIDFDTRVLPDDDDGFAVRLHHIATFMDSGQAAWERLEQILAASEAQGRLHGPRPRPRPRRVCRHDTSPRPLARDLPAPGRGHRLLHGPRGR
jgi:Glyoxalase/Bleomycin resistance protein/Dioxygenase superfamily